MATRKIGDHKSWHNEVESLESSSSTVVGNDNSEMLEGSKSLGLQQESKKEAIGTIRKFSGEEGSEAGGTDYGNTGSLTLEQIALHALHVEDDPSLNPWTFRTWFLGIGLSAFSSTLATIYSFKPQAVPISITFLAVVSYVLGLFLEKVIPKTGLIGRWLNPHPFNSKEHTAILIMASTATRGGLANEVIAVQRLFYNKAPSAAISIFLLISSQTLGYGIAGLLRKTLVYPTKFVYPENLPTAALLETLHRKKAAESKQLKLFYWTFALIFVYEIFPEYMIPLLTGVSVFCLARQNSMTFTNLFGGANSNEGLGLFSFSFDFLYIGTRGFYLPLVQHLVSAPKKYVSKYANYFETIVNILVGYILCIIVFLGLYYGNVWRARDFPFLSQLLFSPESNSTNYIKFNQTLVLDDNNVLNEDALKQTGVPFLTATFASHILTQNLGIAATFTQLFLYNFKDLKTAWSFISLQNLKTLVNPRSWNLRFWESTAIPEETEDMDAHYKLMLAYKDVPNWWYGLVFILATTLGLISVYVAGSGLVWWSFFIAITLAAIMILFVGAQTALTGFHAPIQPLMQMIGAFLQPGKPLTNMYFILFTDNTVFQGNLLLQDLKLGQYAKLPPRCLFTMQIFGTLIGAVLSYAMMLSITTNQRDILLSIEGTNIWSGQFVQSFNSEAISWGALSKHLYSIHSRYHWIPLALPLGLLAPLPPYFLHRLYPNSPLKFHLWNIPIVAWHIGGLSTGITSSRLSFFIVAFFSQFWLRKYRASWFLKYNYVLAAGLEGGTQVMVFLLTFIFQGAGGKPIKFPTYWGNNAARGNIDYCMNDPAKGS